MKIKNDLPLVSIIIPTHNSEKTLGLCLKSLENQDFTSKEIIIIDSLSADKTLELAKRFSVLVFSKTGNASLGRNFGIENAKGKYVLFLDSDQYLDPSVIDECVKKCEEKEAEMVRIPEVFVGNNFWSICSAIWKNNHEGVEFLYKNSSSLLQGKPRFFLKKRVIDAGMFDVRLVWGEDFDLYQRLKKLSLKEAFCSSAIYHIEDISPKNYLLKNLRYSTSIPDFMKYSKEEVFPSMMHHTLLTFFQLFKQKQPPKIIAGCAFLLSIKIISTIIGMLIGI